MRWVAMGFQSGGMGCGGEVWRFWGRRRGVWMGLRLGAQSWWCGGGGGEEAEVGDADQAVGDTMDGKAGQKRVGGNGHDLVLAAVSIVSPAEGGAMVLESHEAMVGDGDAMGIAGQVVENMFSTAEGWLGVNDPVLSAELPEEMVEAAG